MPSIVTLTFSPCIDKSFSVPVLVPEQKLHCSYPVAEPGGGGVNVARALKKLGTDALAVFPSGGYAGRYFNYLLSIENVQADFVETARETRENIIVWEESTGKQYRFGMPGTVLSATNWQDCLHKVEQAADVAYVVVSGNIPPGVPTDIFSMISRIAREKQAHLVVDSSGEMLKRAAHNHVYLMKPSLRELTALANRETILPEEIPAIAGGLVRNGVCDWMLVSLGAHGAMLVSKDQCIHISAPHVQKKGTVGAGDSLVAGLLQGLLEGKTMEQAACYGVACGTAATLHTGTQLCSRPDADRLLPEVKVKIIDQIPSPVNS